MSTDLKIEIDSTEVVAATNKVNKLADTLAIMRGELIEVNNKNIKLADGLTKMQAGMLASLKAAGATTQQMKEFSKTLEQMNKFMGTNPFDKSSNPLVFAKKQREEIEKSIKLSEKYNDLTKQQLALISRGEQFARQKAAAENMNFGQREAYVKKYLGSIVEELRAQNALETSVKAKNAAERDRLKIQQQQEESIKRQKELSAQHERNLKDYAANREKEFRKEVEEWRRKEEEKVKATQKAMMDINMARMNETIGAFGKGGTRSNMWQELYGADHQKALQAEKELQRAKQQTAVTQTQMMQGAVDQYRRNQAEISKTIAKLKEQRDALIANQSVTTGNISFRLNQAGATPQQIEQAKALRREIEELGRAARRTNDPLYGLQGVLRGIIPALGALSGAALVATGGRKFVEVADAIQMLSNRIRILSNETVEFEPAFANLKTIADTSRTPIMELGTLYARLIPVMQSAGKTADYAGQVTEAFALAMTISGTTAQEARSGLLQFSQAMSSATFNGDEFRAISEAVPEVLRVLEKQLGVTRAELRKMSADGKLTSDIVGKALVDSIGELQERVKSAPKTISQSLTLMNNEFIVLTKNINDTFNITNNIAEFVQGLSSVMKVINDNKEVVMGWSSALLTVGTVIGGTLLVALGGLVAQVAGATIATAAFVSTFTDSTAVTAAFAAAAGLATLAVISYAKASIAGAGAVGLLTKATAAFNAVLSINPLIRGAMIFTAAIAGIMAYRDATEQTTKEVLGHIDSLENLQKKQTDLINTQTTTVKQEEEKRQQIEETSKKMDEQKKVIEDQIASRQAMIDNARANPLTDTTSGSPQAIAELRQMTEEVERLRNALYQLNVDSNNTDNMRNASRAAAAKAREQSKKFVGDLAMQLAGYDTKKLEQFGQAVQKLEQQVAQARNRGYQINDADVQKRIDQLRQEFGLVEKTTKAVGEKNKKQSEGADPFLKVQEKINDAYIKQVGVAEKLTETEKLRRDIINDTSYLKLTAEQRKLLDLDLQMLEAVEQFNILQEDQNRKLEEKIKLQQEFIEKLKESDNAYFDITEELTKQRQEIEKSNEDIAFQLSIIGKTADEQEKLTRQRDISNKFLAVEKKLQEDIAKIKKEVSPELQADAILEAERVAAEARKGINTEIALDAAKEYQEKFKEIQGTLSDIITTALFEGGKAGQKKLKDLLKNAFKNFVIDVFINPITKGITGTIMSALGMDGSGGILNRLSNLNTAYNALTSGIAGSISTLGSYVTSFGNAVGSTSISAFGTGMQGAYLAPGMAGPTTVGAGGAMGAGAQTAGYMQSAGTVAAGVIGGHYLGRGISGGYSTGGSGNANVNAGTAIGAAVGSIIPVIGTFLGGLVGGALGGVANRMFGRKTTFQGIKGTVGGETGFVGYTETFRKGGWFKSDDVSRGVLGEMERSGIANDFTLVKNGILEMASTLGIGADALDHFSKKISLDMRGSLEEQQKRYGKLMDGLTEDLAKEALRGLAKNTIGEEAVQAFAAPTRARFQRKRDDLNAQWDIIENPTYQDQEFQTYNRSGNPVYRMAFGIGGRTREDALANLSITEERNVQKVINQELDKIVKQFARNGETAVETLTRLHTVLGTTNNVMEQLGLTLFEASIDGYVAAEALQTAMGGADNAGRLLQQYFDLFYSEQERLDTSLRKINQIFTSLNLKLPNTLSEYRKLVEAQDLNTESGRQMYSTLMQIAPAFAEVNDAMTLFSEEYLSNFTDALNESANSSIKVIDDLMQYRSSLLLGGSSILKPTEKYEIARSEYQSIAAAAASGDQDAALKLKKVSEDFLEASRRVFGSSAQYTSDFGSVISNVDNTLSVQDLQLKAANDSLNLLESIDTNIAAIVVEQYERTLNRTPEAEGLKYWANILESGVSLENFKLMFNNAAITELVNRAYADIGRIGIGTEVNQIDAEGFNHWVDLLRSGEIQLSNFTETFNNAVNRYIESLPSDPYSMYVSSFRGYADGGYYGGGLALVGEQGPELINFRNPGQVYTASQTSSILGSGDDSSVLQKLQNVCDKIEQLERTVAQGAVMNAEATNKNTEVISDVISESSSKSQYSSKVKERSTIK